MAADPAMPLPIRRLAARIGAPWRVSVTVRILTVNVIALALLAGSLFYIDSYRRELLAERFRLARAEAEIAASGLTGLEPRQQEALLLHIGRSPQLRLRLYRPDGTLAADSFDLGDPAYELVDPANEPWLQDAARRLDRGMDFLLGAPPLPAYRDSAAPRAAAWEEIAVALDARATVVRRRAAPDETPVIIAATPVGSEGAALLVTRNARDITQYVRDARQTLAIIVGAALIVSVLLSLVLARTIVKPLRQLVRAAVRVRLGRDRNVVVPRLPESGDEIGLLARAISDMTGALRQRIDAVESFAADVAHELKNPRTSLRSALESMERVADEDLRRQLLAIAGDDVRRIDFLVTEISNASRIDAELSRAVFEPVDLDRLVTALVGERDQRGVNADCKVTIRKQDGGPFTVAGDASRLERVMHNLLDNAVSFSAKGARVDLVLSGGEERIVIQLCDEGPGIPEDAHERVFQRFHSLRPERETTARHSGLGLAIARTIAEAHFGTLVADERPDRRCGACLTMTLPAWRGEA